MPSTAIASTLWSGPDDCRVKARVVIDSAGGLRFRYTATNHGKVRCEFTLWSEVGQPYQRYFDEFHKLYELRSDPIEYPGPPWLADRCVKRKEV